MIVYFVGLLVVGLIFLYLSNKRASPDFKQNELSGVRTTETLADAEIWHKVNLRSALYYKHCGLSFIALAFASVLFARGILAILVFVAAVAFIVILLWRLEYLKEYAKELFAEKHQDSLEGDSADENSSEDKE